MNLKKLTFLFIFVTFMLANDIDIKDLIKKARSGDAKAMYKLGLMYENGEKVEKNFQKSMYWYKKAARTLQQTDNTPLFKALRKTQESKHIAREKRFFDMYIDKYDDSVTNESLFQIISSSFGLHPYKSNYILPVTYDSVKKGERKDFETKFQLSVKKVITDNLFGLNEQIVGAYTQTCWWQTFEDSAPFRETNYRPEIFVQFPSYWSKTALKSYKIGMLHESNGQKVEDSRSWNKLYIEALFQLKHIFVNLNIWYRLPESAKKDKFDPDGDDNPDIYKYLGYSELEFIYPYKRHLFDIKLRNNLDFSDNKGSVEFNWTFPVPNILNEKNVFGYIQYFNGYGDGLIDYNHHSNKIGIGLAFSR